MDEFVEYVAIGLVSFMALVNFGTMVRLSIGKIILGCKKSKHKKLQKKN